MTSLTVRAPAKINLTLDVLARRPDGYHEIRSVMQTIALHDTLTVTLIPDAPGIRLDVDGPEAEGVPADHSNIVYRAALYMLELAPPETGLHIALTKNIPSQAGLGGGSSDAASTLQAVNRLLDLQLSRECLCEIAAGLGADVPFFLTGGTCLVEGVGERVTPLPPLSPAWHLVIVKPSAGVSTAWAYAALDALPNRAPGRATADWLAGRKRLGNDFETVILPAAPEVAAAFSPLEQPLLCGSGSALFCRVNNDTAAQEVAAQVRAAGVSQAWVTKTIGADQ